MSNESTSVPLPLPFEAITAAHSELEALDTVRLQKAKRLKAPATEKGQDPMAPRFRLDVGGCEGRGDIHSLLLDRSSIRDYSDAPVSFESLSRIIHFAYGIKRFRGNVYHREQYPVSFSPSAGGLQPFNVYVFVSNVTSLDRGLYYYSPLEDSMVQQYAGAPHLDLSSCYVTEFPLYAPVNIFITGDCSRFGWKYGLRGYRLLNVDCGILAENITLLTAAEGLGSCMIAAFNGEAISVALRLPDTELPLLAMSIGAEHVYTLAV